MSNSTQHAARLLILTLETQVTNARFAIGFAGIVGISGACRQQIAAALVDIALLRVLIVLAIIVFAKVSTLAAWLMMPYALWVALTLTLNASIWRRNSRAGGAKK